MSELVGYIRKTSDGKLTISISVDAFMEAEREVAKSGNEYVRLTVSTDRVQQLLNGQKEVTGVIQVRGSEYV